LDYPPLAGSVSRATPAALPGRVPRLAAAGDAGRGRCGSARLHAPPGGL